LRAGTPHARRRHTPPSAPWSWYKRFPLARALRRWRNNMLPRWHREAARLAVDGGASLSTCVPFVPASPHSCTVPRYTRRSLVPWLSGGVGTGTCRRRGRLPGSWSTASAERSGLPPPRRHRRATRPSYSAGRCERQCDAFAIFCNILSENINFFHTSFPKMFPVSSPNALWW
jgi:hypothetical protein